MLLPCGANHNTPPVGPSKSCQNKTGPPALVKNRPGPATRPYCIQFPRYSAFPCGIQIDCRGPSRLQKRGPSSTRELKLSPMRGARMGSPAGLTKEQQQGFGAESSGEFDWLTAYAPWIAGAAFVCFFVFQKIASASVGPSRGVLRGATAKSHISPCCSTF